MSTDWRKAAFVEFEERRRIKIAEISQARSEADKFLAIAKMREVELSELDKAASVLGIVIAKADIKDAGAVSETADEASAAEGRGFKDLAVEALKTVHPRPLRASEIQTYVERKLVRKFHEKTAGMTLFRLSKDGVVRRSGWDWYFVPEDDRTYNLRDADEHDLPADNDEGGQALSH